MEQRILIREPNREAVFALVLIKTKDGVIAEIESGPRKGQMVHALPTDTTPMKKV